ncbi:hypothetical protein LPJ61_001946 [Coemansia biformis]|uniref:BHLH domain-containing protein n=1 Tax=Coemansia biformis TaxID=1286918 RepID=A0A9W7Y960_9FUNG|nr:hypothetical protein LPJ61_001946 [Coemansia biformis]
MAFPAQQSMFFLEALGGDGDGLAQAAAAQQHQHQHQQQHMAAVSMDGRVGTSPYFIGGHMLGGSMYGVNPLLVEAPQVSATLAAASTGGAVGAEGRRRSPTNSIGQSPAGGDHAQRRATHNAIERARRESLNGQFQDLASAVPALVQVRRPSKATIVEKSLDYIRTFREHLGNRDQYIKKLQLRNLALHDEVNRLRSQLGLEPLSEACESDVMATAAVGAIGTVAKENPDEEMTTTTEAAAAGSPHKTPACAPALNAVSAPANLTMQMLPLQKRRQQSLDLGMSRNNAGRPALRVHTASITPKHAGVSSGDSSDGVASTASSSSSSPLLHGSPLSAPLLTHAPQLPAGDAMMVVNQQAAAAAAAFVAHTSQQSLAAAQFAAMGVSFPVGMATPNLASPLQVGAMGGYLVSAAHGPQPPLSVIDMTKLSEVFAATPAATARAMSLMAEMNEPSSLGSAAKMDAAQFSRVSQ